MLVKRRHPFHDKTTQTPLSPLQFTQFIVFQLVIGSGVALNPATIPLHRATTPLYISLAEGELLFTEYSVGFVVRRASDVIGVPSEW